MIRIGYHSTDGYKLLDLVNNQVVINRDVIINELKEWVWNENVNKDLLRIFYEEPTSEVKRKVRHEEVGGQASTSRPLRERKMLARLQECVITSNDFIYDEGELVHYAFYAGTEPVNVDEAFKDSEWMKVVNGEIKFIEVNHT